MTADEIGKLETPLTDAAHGEGRFVHCVDDDFARRLEQDRAALMEALEVYQAIFFGRLGNLEHMSTEEFRAAHLRAYEGASETLAAVRSRSKEET